MKRLLLSLLTLVCVSAHAEQSNTLPACETPVRFVAQAFEDPPVDHSRSLAKLARVADAGDVPPGGMRLGHTMVEARLSIHPRKDCDGHDVELAYVDVVQRVARELHEGTCGFSHVLEHEKTHLRIYRDMARQFAELTLPAGRGPETALEFARDQYEVLYKQQTAFDSTAEYRKNLTACDGEILRLLRERARD
jgi:hypothetical protein